MRTTTNIYLFNLAVADLATLLFAMPSELYLMWRQYPWTLGEVHTSFVLYKIRNQEFQVKTFKFLNFYCFWSLVILNLLTLLLNW